MMVQYFFFYLFPCLTNRFFFSTLSTLQATVVIFLLLSLLICSSCPLGGWARFSAREYKFPHHSSLSGLVKWRWWWATHSVPVDREPVFRPVKFKSLELHLFLLIFCETLLMINEVEQKHQIQFDQTVHTLSSLAPLTEQIEPLQLELS